MISFAVEKEAGTPHPRSRWARCRRRGKVSQHKGIFRAASTAAQQQSTATGQGGACQASVIERVGEESKRKRRRRRRRRRRRTHRGPRHRVRLEQQPVRATAWNRCTRQGRQQWRHSAQPRAGRPVFVCDWRGADDARRDVSTGASVSHSERKACHSRGEQTSRA